MTRVRPDAAALAAYLEDEVTASERAEIEAELAASASARKTLGQLRNVKDLLQAADPALEDIDMVARVRIAARQPAPPPAARTKRFAAMLLGGLAASLGCWLFLAARPARTDDAAEFRAKANGAMRSEAARWAGIQILRLSASGTPEPVGDHVAVNEGLLFSYTNLGPQPLSYLMIFAIDSRGEVHWFHPAYETAGENPQAVPIERGRANVPLAELVQQSFSEGPL
ncbi:MAG TPA: hypothetical protein VEQ58_22745, partial [Polyangiaceae bacterium]|nr:hypothetical protein [Polyangiaceae bacterium]